MRVLDMTHERWQLAPGTAADLPAVGGEWERVELSEPARKLLAGDGTSTDSSADRARARALAERMAAEGI